jgi:hypothetical protein
MSRKISIRKALALALAVTASLATGCGKADNTTPITPYGGYQTNPYGTVPGGVGGVPGGCVPLASGQIPFSAPAGYVGQLNLKGTAQVGAAAGVAGQQLQSMPINPMTGYPRTGDSQSAQIVFNVGQTGTGFSGILQLGQQAICDIQYKASGIPCGSTYGAPMPTYGYPQPTYPTGGYYPQQTQVCVNALAADMGVNWQYHWVWGSVYLQTNSTVVQMYF